MFSMKRDGGMARSKRSKGLKDPVYLAWMRRQSCLLCNDAIEKRTFVGGMPYRQMCQTEAAHVGQRGLSQKCSDHDTIPLCAWHHRISRESHHRLGKLFWGFHGINRRLVIAGYRKLFAMQKAA